jgi:hypothetical protein
MGLNFYGYVIQEVPDRYRVGNDIGDMVEGTPNISAYFSQPQAVIPENRAS